MRQFSSMPYFCFHAHILFNIKMRKRRGQDLLRFIFPSRFVQIERKDLIRKQEDLLTGDVKVALEDNLNLVIRIGVLERCSLFQPVEAAADGCLWACWLSARVPLASRTSAFHSRYPRIFLATENW